MNIFDGIDEYEKNKILTCLNARTITFKKNSAILTNASNIGVLSVVTKGKAEIIRIDYNGNKTIIETLNEGDIFESRMFNLTNNEINIISVVETEVILIEYKKLMSPCIKSCSYHTNLIENLFQIIISRLNHSYEHIQILTKKSIRDKLLEYFKFLSNAKGNKRFKLPTTISDLANYLAVDRSALTREIKHLKEDGFIEIENKMVKINY